MTWHPTALREAIYQSALAQLIEDRAKFGGDRSRDRVVPLAAREVKAPLIHSRSRERQRPIAR